MRGKPVRHGTLELSIASIAGDRVSIQVERALVDVTSAMLLRSRHQRPVRVVELLQRAQRELAEAEIACHTERGRAIQRTGTGG